MDIEQGSLAHVAHFSDTQDYSFPRYCSVYNPRTRCQKVIIIDAQSVKTCEQKKLCKPSCSLIFKVIVLQNGILNYYIQKKNQNHVNNVYKIRCTKNNLIMIILILIKVITHALHICFNDVF